jgi:hypothetical protein
MQSKSEHFIDKKACMNVLGLLPVLLLAHITLNSRLVEQAAATIGQP